VIHSPVTKVALIQDTQCNFGWIRGVNSTCARAPCTCPARYSKSRRQQRRRAASGRPSSAFRTSCPSKHCCPRNACCELFSCAGLAGHISSSGTVSLQHVDSGAAICVATCIDQRPSRPTPNCWLPPVLAFTQILPQPIQGLWERLPGQEGAALEAAGPRVWPHVSMVTCMQETVHACNQGFPARSRRSRRSGTAHGWHSSMQQLCGLLV